MKTEFVQISDNLFGVLGKLITDTYGIKMSPEKKIMFQSRMQRRLAELQIDSFDEYAILFADEKKKKEELHVISDYISTNKTEFFREFEHFEFLTDRVLPEIRDRRNEVSKLNIWSAGCSSGQEAYSICMTIEEFKRRHNAEFSYHVLATDISERMLKIARNAVYPLCQVTGISIDLKRRYLLKSKNPKDQKVRIVQELREKVRVGRLNLMESLGMFQSEFDVIFLRNTLIYFSPQVQLTVLREVVRCLKPGGYLFIGHSESLVNLDLPIRPVAPSVYVKI